MKLRTPHSLTAAAREHAPPPVKRAQRLSTLLAVVLGLGLGLSGPAPAGAAAAYTPHSAANLTVGHTVKHIDVRDSATQTKTRKVAVHLWYPADQKKLADAPRAVYTSALHYLASGQLPAGWDPLAWTIQAEIARQDNEPAGNKPAIDEHGQPFPVIVFSHGATNDPIDYAYTLERIAAEGYVVAAPYHVNNTQDDVRIDFVNNAAGKVLIECNDGRPKPCARPDLWFSMADRVHDVSAVLDHLPEWFGGRADVTRAGVLGHSRGTVTALAAAGGSAEWCGQQEAPICSRPVNCIPSKPQPKPPETPRCWPNVEPDSRVKAIMGLAIGGAPVTRGVDLKNVGVPTLLLAGRLDHNSTHEVSEEAFGAISSTDKAYVLIGKATHRSFDSTYCAQMQAAAAVADKGGGPHGEPDGTLDPDEVNTWAEHAKLDWHTVQGIATSFPGGLSGKAVHYCSPDYFTTPIWIAPAVARFNPFSEVAEPLRDLGSPPSAVSSATCPAATPTVVPCTGLDTEEVKQGVTDLATTFFGTVLKSGGADGMHFTRYLAPKWLEKHIPMVDSAIAIASGKAVCPPGQEVTCAE